MFNISTFDPKVCAAPAFLKTLKTLGVGKIFNTCKNSPLILIVLPTDSEFGILFKKISCTAFCPLAIAVIDTARPTVSVLTPTLKVSVKFWTDVLKPDIWIALKFGISIKGKNVPFTWFWFTCVKTTDSNDSKVDSIEDTPKPTISLTFAENPEPPVPSSSKMVVSPILYPLPGFKIDRSCKPPLTTDSTFDDCLTISFDSNIKSLFANFSATLYGKVFLKRDELLKSNDCVNNKLSSINGDRYVLPMKYG